MGNENKILMRKPKKGERERETIWGNIAVHGDMVVKLSLWK
jgi:hypothetical protein